MNQRGWVILMTFLAGVLVAAGWFSSRSVESVQVSPAIAVPVNEAPQPSSPAPAPSQEEGVPAVRQAAPTVAPAPEPTVVAPPPPSFVPRPERATPRPPKHPVDPETLQRESALLDRAKELVRSDPEQALRELSELREQFPDGALAKDEELVRVEAYLRLGRRDEAEALGKKLVGKEPSTGKTVDRLLQRIRPN